MAFIQWDELVGRFRGHASYGTSQQQWPDAPAGGWEIELVWTEIEGRSECVGMVVLGDGSEPLTASLLRRVPLGTLITENRRRELERVKNKFGEGFRAMQEAAYREWGQSGQEGPRPALSAEELSPIDLKAQRLQLELLTASRRRYDPEHYERVAAIYDEAITAGIPPTAHVQNELGLRTRTQAAKQVARARERGLLPPTEQRIAKGNEP